MPWWNAGIFCECLKKDDFQWTFIPIKSTYYFAWPPSPLVLFKTILVDPPSLIDPYVLYGWSLTYWSCHSSPLQINRSSFFPFQHIIKIRQLLALEVGFLYFQEYNGGTSSSYLNIFTSIRRERVFLVSHHQCLTVDWWSLQYSWKNYPVSRRQPE